MLSLVAFVRHMAHSSRRAMVSPLHTRRNSPKTARASAWLTPHLGGSMMRGGGFAGGMARLALSIELDEVYRKRGFCCTSGVPTKRLGACRHAASQRVVWAWRMESCCRSQRRYSPATQWAAEIVHVAVPRVGVRKSKTQPWNVPCCSHATMPALRGGHWLFSLANEVADRVNFIENASSCPTVCLHSSMDEAPPDVPVLQFWPQV